MSGPGEPGGAGAAPAADASRAGEASRAAAATGDAIDPRVAEVLQQLRSGVRQRQAEAATVGGLPGSLEAPGGPAGFAQGLLAVKAAEYVEEPVPFSHRPRLGKLVVGSRKAFFHLLLKWFLRPVLAQQNAFNQAAGRMLQDLAEAQERTAREVRLLAALVAELETRVEVTTASAASAADAPRAGAAPAAPSASAPPPEPPGGGEPRR
jgi:hypothetical protein